MVASALVTVAILAAPLEAGRIPASRDDSKFPAAVRIVPSTNG
jgi:hypothetical protein